MEQFDSAVTPELSDTRGVTWAVAVARARKTSGDARAVLAARWYLRSADHLGTRVRVWGRPSVKNAGDLIVRDRVQIVSTIATCELVTAPGGRLEIGSRCLINYGTSIAASSQVVIGDGCLLGTYSLLMDNDFHSLSPELRLQRPPSRPITLAANVWLGARVVVLGGVSIGEGSVIGAGSVVTRDVPPRSVAVGVPAQVIRAL